MVLEGMTGRKESGRGIEDECCCYISAVASLPPC